MEETGQKEGERPSWFSGQDAREAGHTDGSDCGQGKWHERWTEKGYSVPWAGHRQMRVSAYTGRQRERHRGVGLGLSRNKEMLRL